MKDNKLEDFVKKRNNSKFLFTVGPASLVAENILGLAPCFGRNDPQYLKVEEKVLKQLKNISGHKKIVRMQGSGSFALEVVSLNFLHGKVLIVSTGYYSDRLFNLCIKAKKNFGKITKISKVNWREIEDFSAKYDWVWACPTETSYGLKIPITDLKKFSKKIKAKLALDATASFGLESFHELGASLDLLKPRRGGGETGQAFRIRISPHNLQKSERGDIKAQLGVIGLLVDQQGNEVVRLREIFPVNLKAKAVREGRRAIYTNKLLAPPGTYRLKIALLEIASWKMSTYENTVHIVGH